jgi:hypothetical protein
MKENEETQLKTFMVTYYGWIPGYNDFDQDQFYIKAKDLEEAKLKVSKMKLFTKSDITIVETLDKVCGL